MMQVDSVGVVVDGELEEFVGFGLSVGDCAYVGEGNQIRGRSSGGFESNRTKT